MKTRLIPVITKSMLALAVVLALLPWVGVADPTTTLDNQRLPDTPPRADGQPKPSIPPYEEKKRIAIPDAFGAGKECYAAAYEAITDEYLSRLNIAALLCFSCNKAKISRTCFEARSHHWFHQFVDHLEIVPVLRDREPREGILFIAAVSSGGSGYTRLPTLWVYRKECGQFVNLLPEILISRSTQFKFLSDPKGKHDSALVVAEQLPAEDSKPYVDRVPCRVTIYQYRHREKEFKPVSFVTEKKYGFAFNVEDSTAAIDDHMGKIRQILDRTSSKRRTP